MSERSHSAEVTPSSIGRYEITGTLGFGAMGAVYRAFDPIIKRPLAIKTIRLDGPRQSPQHRAFIERFYQEARISGTLSHPNIVTLFDIGEEDGAPFLAMEYVEGETVSRLLEEGTRFEPEKVISIASQVASGLDYAHSRGVVHRDIKPSNLIVQDGDKVKVTDFGIAKLIDTEITHPGTLLGTPSYMSPEQAMGEPLDGRSDIFSLGVCAFEMLSGQQPFPGTNVTSILYKLVHVDPIEPAGLEMNGLIPYKWREVFRRVLAKKPEDRYTTAGDFVRDLEYCLGSWFSGLGEETVALDAADDSTVLLPVAPEPSPVGESTAAWPSGGDATARQLEVPEQAETVAIPAPQAPADVKPDDSATVWLKGAAHTPPGATVTLSGPVPDPGSTGEPPPEPTRELEPDPPATAEGPPPEVPPQPQPGTAAAPPPTARPLPVGWILGGAVGLFVLAASVVGWMLWTRGPAPGARTGVLPTPAPPVVEAPPLLPTTGTLRVESEPDGALVTLDGEERGRTPLEVDEIPFGTHEVRLALKGYTSQGHEVSLSADAADAELQASLTRRPPSLGTARFTSTPEGGEVSVDGKSVGSTPVEGVRLRPGRHRVEIALADHEPWSGSVEVAAGGRAVVEAELVPVSAPVSAPPTPEPVDTARIYENKHGEVDRPAKRRSGTSPSYPSDRAPRLKRGERVSVTVTFLVSEAGEVQDVVVRESAGDLVDGVVTSAVGGWKYEPAMIGDVPVKVRVVFRQTFLGG